jgi:hypothetical protein
LRVRYPFEPRSTAYLEPGQFWGIPLSDGRFACGRVLEVPRSHDPLIPVSRRTFLAGLMDWVADTPPSDAAIAGAALYDQGFAHVLALRENGGVVLGARPLELDGLRPRLWLTSAFTAQAWVYRGATPVRPARPGDASLPVVVAWGYKVVSVIAEHAFVANP